MTKAEQAEALPLEELTALLQQYGSIKAVVEYMNGGKQNERMRAVIASRIVKHQLQGMRRQNVSTRYTPDQVVEAIAAAGCWSDVYRALGLSVCDHNKAGIIRFCKHHNIKAPVFSKEDMAKAFQRGKRGWTVEDIFCVDSKYPRTGVRAAAVKYGIGGEYHCCKCKLEPVWDGSSLTLELDHINGNHTDHRPDNLRWICPNCHSQTVTYKGKNRK